MEWRAEVTSSGDVVTVAFHGDLDLLVQSHLRQTLGDITETHRHVLLDLADVRLIDSTGLGLLVRTHQAVKRRGGTVCLVAPSKFVQTVLFTMRLHPVFPIFPDTVAAEEWLAEVRSGTGAHRPVPVE